MPTERLENDEKSSSEGMTSTITTCASEDLKAIAEEAGIGIVEVKNSADDNDQEAQVDAKQDQVDSKQDEVDSKQDEKKEESKEEHKRKYADWPYKNIREPHANDVLYGRGGESVFVCPEKGNLNVPVL